MECWDRQTRDYVAIKVIRSIQKYRDAAMVEIDVLQRLAKNDEGNSGYVASRCLVFHGSTSNLLVLFISPFGSCVKMLNWFDYRNHICIVSIPMKFFVHVLFFLSSLRIVSTLNSDT